MQRGRSAKTFCEKKLSQMLTLSLKKTIPNVNNVRITVRMKILEIQKSQFQMLADPLLTEHYAKAGLGAVLIDQQHGLFVVCLFVGSGPYPSATWFVCLLNLSFG